VSLLVTTTSTAPAEWAGVVAVIVVLLVTLTPVAAVPPKVTVAPAVKPVPVIVMGVPPAVVPDTGEIEVGAGGGGGLCPLPRKVATCITQTPELSVAVAL
jgi:hypothetical protein